MTITTRRFSGNNGAEEKIIIETNKSAYGIKQQTTYIIKRNKPNLIV